MKNTSFAKKTLSLLLAMVLMFPASAGALPAYAEMGAGAAPAGEGAASATAAGSAEEAVPEQSAENNTSAPQKAPPEITEDGHIDGDRLATWLENYLKADHWDEPQCSISIGLWYSGTDETWFYNPDEWMYGINWSKLPVSMYFAEKLGTGELSSDTVINGIQLEYALQTVLESSSGPSFNSMLTYLGGNTVSNCAELVPQYAGLPEDYYTDEFFQKSYYTARIMTEVTKTLYQGGDERFPNVLKYMKESQPWDMFNRDEHIREEVHASQTHAAVWGDGAGDYIHSTGVIYTPTPIVLTVMMKNIADLDIMGGVAHHITVLAEAMDAKQKELAAAEKAAAEQAEKEAEIAETQDSSSGTAEAPAVQSPETPADSAVTPESAAGPGSSAPASAQDVESPTPRILLIAVSGLIVLLLTVIAALRKNGRGSGKGTRRHKRRRP